ncbi:MAG: hypothetical protein PHN31_06560, partial [Candidatus Gracilibacteria bacterium]|nr:hypothetical protein [Candidatus Gracilibacteria bacterium]
MILIIVLGSLFHIAFFGVNEILKNADCFAYLQMSYYFKNLSLSGFGTGWFGFLYSFFIALFDVITFSLNEYISALFLNIILFGISAYLLYRISINYLSKKYSLIVIGLFYLSSVLLNFNITILSENIYIPVFLGFFLYLINFFQKQNIKIKDLFVIALFIALLYFTRAEAFIYLGSIFLIFVFKFFKKKISLNYVGRVVKNFLLVLVFFFLIVSPYLVYLHSVTGDWGLTNKGSSNLRQAELRGSEKMDDEGFEQAVGELTSDNHHLKSGFVGGLIYDKGDKSKGLKTYLLENPFETIGRVLNNQFKLYTKNLPEIVSGDSINLFYSKDSFFSSNYLFYLIELIPVLLLLFGVYKMIVLKRYDFLILFFSFYLVASLFFTLFFVLNRYFLIFLPLFFVFILFFVSSLKTRFKDLFLIVFVFIYILSCYTYYNSIKNADNTYLVKKVAGEWLKNHQSKENKLKILERFPIVTYYSG